MKGDQLFWGQVIVAPKFGSICQKGPVWPNRSRDQGGNIFAGAGRFIPECLNGVFCNGHGGLNEAFSLLFRHSAFHKALIGRLVAGRDDDVGPGCKVVPMDRGDEVRGFSQKPCGPQRIVDICPPQFQLGAQGTVYQERGFMA